MDWSRRALCPTNQPSKCAICCVPASSSGASAAVIFSASRRRWRTKTLEDANIKLDLVVTDVLGLSGRRILQALIAGQTVPQALAALADRRIHATSEQLDAPLRGRVTDHHRFMLKLHLDQIDAQAAAIARIDKEVDG